MATLSKTGITTGATIQVGHITQSIDAFTGTYAYDLIISGTLNATGSVITGSISHATSASRAINVQISNTVANQGYTIPYLASTGSTLTGLYYSATGPVYNPVTERLLTTSSWSVSSSYALSYATPTQIDSVVYPSGSPSIPSANLKMIAGASKTGTPTPTVAINITQISGKTLGTNCFVTATVSGSGASSIVVNSLVASTLTFESQSPGTDFHYHIMYY